MRIRLSIVVVVAVLAAMITAPSTAAAGSALGAPVISPSWRKPSLETARNWKVGITEVVTITTSRNTTGECYIAFGDEPFNGYWANSPKVRLKAGQASWGYALDEPGNYHIGAFCQIDGARYYKTAHKTISVTWPWAR